MRVLMLTLELPTRERPGTWAAVARQVESIRSLAVDVDLLEIKGRGKVKYLEALPRLLRRSSDADLVHAHYGYCGCVGRAQWKRPLVVSFMGSDLLGTSDSQGRVTTTSRPVVAVDRVLARLADAVIVKSREMAEVLTPIEAHVIPNGVDLEVFRPADRERARTLLGWETEGPYVLFAGSPTNPRKGYPLAVRSVERARAQLGPNVRLMALAGIPADQVPVYMNACDALLVTSHWEGSPNAVKEAMACNLPIVSVGVGDVPDLLGGVEACEVHPRDPSRLGDALVRVITAAKPSTGRARLQEKRLDLFSVARRVADVYEHVLASRN
jgi:glycosyltransferase involved in cell wall biosynthesis